MSDEPLNDGATERESAHDEARPDMGLRTTGFLVTVAGALLAGIGSVLDWIVVTIDGIGDDLAPTWRGLDIAGGKLVLAGAGVALLAVLTSRVGSTAAARRGAAIVVLVVGVAIVAAAALEALSAEDRYVSDAIEQARDTVASLGIPTGDLDAVLAELQGALEVHLEIGVWVAMAGGALVAAGGAVTLSWASRAREADPTAADDEDGCHTSVDERRTQDARLAEPPPPPIGN